MPRVCTVCTHPQGAAINRALVGGEPNRRIATQYAVSEAALRRHHPHIPTSVSKAQEKVESVQGDDLLRDIRALRSKAVGILIDAEKAKDYRTALMGIREARACMEFLAKLLGEIDDRPQIGIVVAPEWLAVRRALLSALTPYPEARAAVAERLLTLQVG